MHLQDGILFLCIQLSVCISDGQAAEIAEFLGVCAFINPAFVVGLLLNTHRFSGTPSNQILILNRNKRLKVISQVKEHSLQL